MKKVICILKGGLGNQLFTYAAAKRLAIYNNAELVIDVSSGFIRDYKYKRNFMLMPFNIDARLVSYKKLMPFIRLRRKILIELEELGLLKRKLYINQKGNDFNPSILRLQFRKRIYFEGYWQSEKYFMDVKDVIYKEFEIIPPLDKTNQEIAGLIKRKNSVCIHVRWFDNPNNTNAGNNLNLEYYTKAISMIKKKIVFPHFFIFSDYPEQTKQLIKLSESESTYINNNNGDENAYADFWLMTLCDHFIIANSTFSWWGAWLSKNSSKIVIAPSQKKNDEGAWGFPCLIPEKWIMI